MSLLDDFKAKAQWLYGGTARLQIIRAIVSDASLCMLLYRSMTFFNSYRITKPIAAILLKMNAILCGAVIGRGARFGGGFVILHSVGIVINSKVKGGDDIVLESGVVIGEEKKGCPVLGNKIFIGSGAKVFGKISIGDNVTIGANAVVNKSLPDNAVAVGVPARIIRYKSPSE